MKNNSHKENAVQIPEVLRNGVAFLEKAGSSILNYLNKPEVKEGIREFGATFKRLAAYTANQKELMKTMSERGWYPSLYVFTTSKNDSENLDEYMKRCLDLRLDSFLVELIECYPKREKIFREAFELFKLGRHIACIPLFITQIDGISEDNGFSPYFADNSVDKSKYKDPNDEVRIKALKLPKYLDAIIEGKIADVDSGLITFYKDVIRNAADSYIIWNTKKANKSKVENPLNRHGIMHGHIDFLDYGDPINSYKIISLLYFVHEITQAIAKD